MQQTLTDYDVYTRRENSPKQDLVWETHMSGEWPEFMYHDVFSDIYMPDYFQLCVDSMFYICDGLDVIAHGKAIPVYWSDDLAALPDEGWDWALKNGIELARMGGTPNMLSALEMVIAPAFRGKGLSQIGLKLMRQIATEQGLHQLIAPVRPSQKHLYPLIDMQDYITWRREDGFSFDAWLRTHERMGASIIKVAPHSMIIEGTVSEWGEWAQMSFPGSGDHIVPLALQPVSIDLEADKGVYVEANVWMVHELGT